MQPAAKSKISHLAHQLKRLHMPGPDDREVDDLHSNKGDLAQFPGPVRFDKSC